MVTRISRVPSDSSQVLTSDRVQSISIGLTASECQSYRVLVFFWGFFLVRSSLLHMFFVDYHRFDRVITSRTEFFF